MEFESTNWYIVSKLDDGECNGEIWVNIFYFKILNVKSASKSALGWERVNRFQFMRQDQKSLGNHNRLNTCENSFKAI